ncbi:glycosyltransferase family 4 protein [Stipitochalara longipes BDJ]|nr:glycosyltransferase family 4 protein [Stipitochalara longipes BDJ]
MRVLLISDVYFPRINGVSTSIQTVLRGLPKGHEACLIAPDYGLPWDDEGYDIIRIRSHPTPGDHEDRVMYGGEIRKLYRQLEDRDFDAVHIHGFGIAFYEGVRLAKQLRLPVLSTYHTNFDEYLPHYVTFLPAAVTRYGCRQAAIWQCNAVDAVVVPSHAMAQTLKSYGVHSQLHVIPTGLDLNRFRIGEDARFRKRYGIASDRQVLLFVGRVAREKSVDFLIRMLIEVVPCVPDVLLVIAGDGQDLERCRNLAVDLGIHRNVLFVGWLDRDTELMDCYAASNIFVFASKTETQGLSLLEAMAMGISVVSISCLGSADTLQSNCGAVIVPDDEQQFAAQTCRLLKDNEEKVKLGIEGKQYAKSWSASTMVYELFQVYQGTQPSDEAIGRYQERMFWETTTLILIAFYVFFEGVQDWMCNCYKVISK